jgi:hypothetical protein
MEAPERFWQTPREWARDLAAATVIGVFMGVIGPFGSFYGGALELRVLYWIVNVWLGFIILSLTVRGSAMLGARYDLPIWFVLPAGIVVGSLPLAEAITLFSGWFWPRNHGHFALSLDTYEQCLIISLPFSIGYYLFVRAQDSVSASAVSAPAVSAAAIPPPSGMAAATPGAPGFLDRMPPRIGRDLLCLQMEDHYVRAHTQKGSDLILIPLKDAIAELGDTPGMQVHRSWWVARTAVSAPVANGRNLSLRLSNDLLVPVSRASVAKLKAAGWIAPSDWI